MGTPRSQQAPPLQNASIEKKALSSGVHIGSDEINTLIDSGAYIDGTVLDAFMRLLHPKKGVKCIPTDFFNSLSLNRWTETLQDENLGMFEGKIDWP
eukprot:1857308-Ditylum_brightwellii.AAC.1